MAIDYRTSIANMFREHGYWLEFGYSFALAHEYRSDINIPDEAKITVDVLAYRPASNKLWWIVYPSSTMRTMLGQPLIVTYEALTTSGTLEATYFRLFNQQHYREVVSTRLIEVLINEGRALPDPILGFGLVCKELDPESRPAVEELFRQNGWLLLEPGGEALDPQHAAL